MKRMACALALAAGSGVAFGTVTPPALADPTPANAASGLEITITTLSAVVTDSSIALDVNFRGGNIRAIELYVDGTLATKKTLSTRDGHGMIRFDLDQALLGEGDHAILIKAYAHDGSSATATTHVHVTPSDVNALARLLSPKKNAVVQEIVALQVKVDSSIKSPYVTYLLDNKFLAFTNIAPFTYNWDSTRVADGPHTIGIEVYDGETFAKVKGVTVPIRVNNVGGFTHLQPTTPDLNSRGGIYEPDVHETSKTSASGTIERIARDVAQSAAPASHSGLLQANPVLARNGLNSFIAPKLRFGTEFQNRYSSGSVPTAGSVDSTPHREALSGGPSTPAFPGIIDLSLLINTPSHAPTNGNSVLRISDPGSLPSSAPNAAAMALRISGNHRAPELVFGNAPMARTTPDPFRSGPNLRMSPERLAAAPIASHDGSLSPSHMASPPLTAGQPHLFVRLAAPRDLTALAPLLPPAHPNLSRQLAIPRRSGNIAVRPGIDRAPTPPVPAASAQPSAPPIAPETLKALTNAVPNGGPFRIVFDNKPLVFDVMPRVEHGLPMTPFRQIFEHTGGEVKWNNDTKTVRATSSDRAIEIQVGKTEAKVNSQSLRMEAKPYLERGRTIVPLSFIRDAMDVEIHYDPKTGHLLIESKK